MNPVYNAESDPSYYRGTTVLKNKLGLKTQDALDQFELAVYLVRADEPWPDGELDERHYKALHRHLFQDVYSWAGKTRTIRIAKGESWFCYPEFIEAELKRIFQNLRANGFLMELTHTEFAMSAAHLIAEINAAHPFREGNGRTQLAFLSMLAENAGLPFNDKFLDRKRVINAMVDSFRGNEHPLAHLILDIITV